ncbi:MAG TPA: ACP phosphodiesterase [Ferruginibacter sp.]|nr:ACP phosphodiesterase [Ferruginibacter sp.]HMP20630.1 ACP phosphodiesterase [Ferruginibacter sp.]
MNLLAHAFLSFSHPEILVGNMISDYVKGKKKFAYTPGIQKGITLHRAIDAYTDTHPATAKAKVYFRNHYRLYAGAFVDIVYDHFLANDNMQFSDAEAHAAFCSHTYKQLLQYRGAMPGPFSNILPYMHAQNWLYHYRYKEGIQRSFEGLVRRAAYLQSSDAAFNSFNEHYEALQACYNEFFPSLKSFTIHTLHKLINT